MIFRLQNYEKLKEGQRGFAMCNCANARMCCAYLRKSRARARIHRSLCKLLSPVTGRFANVQSQYFCFIKPLPSVFSVHAHDRNFQQLTNFYPLMKICCHPYRNLFYFAFFIHLRSIYIFAHLHICTFAKHGVTDESRMYKLRWSARVRAHAKRRYLYRNRARTQLQTFPKFGLRAQRVGPAGNFNSLPWNLNSMPCCNGRFCALAPCMGGARFSKPHALHGVDKRSTQKPQ